METESLQKTSDLCHHDPGCSCCKKRSIPTSQKSPKVLALLSLIWLGTAAFIGSKPSNYTILLRTSSLGKANTLVIENSPKLRTSSPLLIIIVFSHKVKCMSHQVLVWKPSWRIVSWIKDLHISLKHSFSILIYSCILLQHFPTLSVSFLSWWCFSSKLPQWLVHKLQPCTLLFKHWKAAVILFFQLGVSHHL